MGGICNHMLTLSDENWTKEKKSLSSEFVEEQPDEHQEKTSYAPRSVHFEEVDMDFELRLLESHYN